MNSNQLALFEDTAAHRVRHFLAELHAFTWEGKHTLEQNVAAAWQ